jgi:hypothetical protein
LNASSTKSDRSTSGNHVTVGLMSDKYQKSVGMYHGWSSGAAPLLSSAMILLKKVLPSVTPMEAKVLLAASSTPVFPAEQPNPEVGYGKLNAPKMILMARLLKENKLQRPLDIKSINQIQNVYNSEYKAKSKLFEAAYKSHSEAERDLNSSNNCEELRTRISKAKLSYFLAQGTEAESAFRDLLQKVYQSVGNYHEAALLSPRDTAGKLMIPDSILRPIMNVKLSDLGYEDYVKFVDLIGGSTLNSQQREVLKQMFQPTLESAQVQSERELNQGTPKEKFALSMLRSHFGSEFQSYIEPIAQKNSYVRQLLNASDKKKE